MRKVPLYLLDTLMAVSESQTVAPYDPVGELCDRVNFVDTSYQKGHTVPEGCYKVKLLDIKCHSKTSYYMEVQILNESSLEEIYGTQPIIRGYGSRTSSNFSDLARCFGDGTPLKSSKAYIGLCGDIYLTHSGWIELMTKQSLLPKMTNLDEVIFGP